MSLDVADWLRGLDLRDQAFRLRQRKAIECFMASAPFAGRRPVFVSDDGMDRAGFDAALTLGGVAFSVGAALPGLSGYFAGPDVVRVWVERLAR